MIYLAIPYSHQSGAVRMTRFHLANLATAMLIERGHVVYSPISHSHVVAQYLSEPRTSWDFWQEQDLPMLDNSSKVVVLGVPGWLDSVGVAAEIKYARSHGKPVYIVHYSPEDREEFSEELSSMGL